jgi:hypothetical protein
MITGRKNYGRGIIAIATAIVMAFGMCVSVGAQLDDTDAAKVKDYYADWLTSIPGVTSVDVGTNEQGQSQIQVHTDKDTPRPAQVPDQLNGIPVVVKAGPDQENPLEPPPPPPIIPSRR